MRLVSITGGLLLSCAFSCSAPGPSTTPVDPEVRAEDEPTALEASELDLVLDRIRARTGDVYAVGELRFTFIVHASGAERVRRSHRWCPAEGRVQVDGLEESEQPVTVAADGDRAPEGSAERAAYEAFVNDGYWLYAPSKLRDPGVQASLADDGSVRLAFDDGTGVTPGDVYWFEHDAQGDVVGWRFRLQGGNEAGFDWTGHRTVGPLRLAMHRAQREGDATIRFEDVSVHDECGLSS